VDTHVIPLLELARKAILVDDALRFVNENRELLPGLDKSLQDLGILTDTRMPPMTWW